MSKLNLIKSNFNELPNNIEAEQSVIGSILITNEIFDEVNTIIKSSNFFDPMHQKNILCNRKFNLQRNVGKSNYIKKLF